MACRLRALQLTKYMGAPQGFAQDWMYIATWTIILQVFLCLILGFVTPSGDIQADEDGNVKMEADLAPHNPTLNLGLRYTLEIIRYLCMIGTYGGALGIGYAIGTMTPTNANGSGSLFPWGPIPQPFDPAEALKNATSPLTTAGSSATGF